MCLLQVWINFRKGLEQQQPIINLSRVRCRLMLYLSIFSIWRRSKNFWPAHPASPRVLHFPSVELLPTSFNLSPSSAQWPKLRSCHNWKIWSRWTHHKVVTISSKCCKNWRIPLSVQILLPQTCLIRQTLLWGWASVPRLRLQKYRGRKNNSSRRHLNSQSSQFVQMTRTRRDTSKLLPVFRMTGTKRSKLRTNWRNASSCSSNASTRVAIVSSRKVATWGIISGSIRAKGHLNAQNATKRSLRVETSVAIWRTSTKFQEMTCGILQIRAQGLLRSRSHEFPRRSSFQSRNRRRLRLPRNLNWMKVSPMNLTRIWSWLEFHFTVMREFKEARAKTMSSLSTFLQHHLHSRRNWPTLDKPFKFRTQRSMMSLGRRPRECNRLSLQLKSIGSLSRLLSNFNSLNLFPDRIQPWQVITNRLSKGTSPSEHYLESVLRKDWSVILHVQL